MKKALFISILMSSVLAMAMTGCSKESSSSGNTIEGDIISQSVSEISLEESSQAEESSNSVSGKSMSDYSVDQLKADALKLDKKALEFASNNDYEGFKSLFIDGSDEQITSSYNFMKGLTNDYYPDDAIVVVKKFDTFAVMNHINSMTSGTHPNTHTDLKYWTYYVAVDNGEVKYKLVPSEEEDALVESTKFEDLCEDAKGYTASDEAGRNAILFDANNLSWIDSSVVLPDALYTSVCAAWQNEDGSVSVLVNAKNGTDQNIYLNTINIALTDESLGTIIASTDQYSNISVTPSIASNTAKNIVLTYPASVIKSGTNKWTNIHASIDTTFR